MKSSFLILCLAVLCAPASFATDFATQVMDATFKLFHQDSTATCVLVKREAPDAAVYLVTAAHVLEKTKGEKAILVLRKTLPDGSYERKDHSITIRTKDTPLWLRNEKQDVAVLKLAGDLPVPVAALTVSSLATEARLKESGVHICSPLFVMTYPQRFEANSAGLPVARQGIFASTPLIPIEKQATFLADYTTFAGDSGGPVFIESPAGRPLIVGIVLAQNHHDEKFKTEYEETLIHHPLNVGNVLHSQIVLDTVEAAAAKQSPPPGEETPK